MLAILPARIGSTRLPRKPLRRIGDEALVVHAAKRVAAMGLFEQVIVATDSEEVLATVQAAGLRAALTPAAPSGSVRVLRLAQRLGCTGPVINIQGDQPGITTEAVAALCKIMQGRHKQALVGTIACPWADQDPSDPSKVCVWSNNGEAVDFSRSVTHLKGPSLWHQGLYGFSPDAVAACLQAPVCARRVTEDLEQLDWLAAGVRCRVALVQAPTGSVDTEEDLRRAQERWVASL